MVKKHLSVSKKTIKNTKDGFHFNSSHWQNYKKDLPPLPENLFNICIGMILGDGSLFKKSLHSGIKFEQGYKQKDFLYHLFNTFSKYTFMDVPGQRISFDKEGKPFIKSHWFKTFSYYNFTELWNLFCKNGKKGIVENLINKHLSPIGFAYWVMCDGSLQKSKKEILIHTQGFTKFENLLAVKELNQKYGLNCRVVVHKHKYWVIKTHPKDAETLHSLLKPFLIPSMMYKLPHIKV